MEYWGYLNWINGYNGHGYNSMLMFIGVFGACLSYISGMINGIISWFDGEILMMVISYIIDYMGWYGIIYEINGIVTIPKEYIGLTIPKFSPTCQVSAVFWESDEIFSVWFLDLQRAELSPNNHLTSFRVTIYFWMMMRHITMWYQWWSYHGYIMGYKIPSRIFRWY